MAESKCKVCDEPLFFEVEDEEQAEDQGSRVPDDLELPCGCHFHWQCLLDQSSSISISLQCPSCDSQLAQNTAGPSSTNAFRHVSSNVAINARYSNEGGVEENFNILPAVTEEAYLESQPAARKARAFHLMCAEGDVSGVVDLLRDAEQPDGDEPRWEPAQILRYRDPLNSSKSALHLAIEKGQEEVVWLLLWTASSLRTEAFPLAATQVAQQQSLSRPGTSPADDIRALKDDEGRTAEMQAAQMGDNWQVLLRAGVLNPELS
ncbi:hypothetical protein F5Y15DRAFT_355185 [Xylariaceae sp. FL0016]|nr:hypothetical protein F5Y15DRAFT_355185 [Xylariaceae sp. FL0016]